MLNVQNLKYVADNLYKSKLLFGDFQKRVPFLNEQCRSPADAITDRVTAKTTFGTENAAADDGDDCRVSTMILVNPMTEVPIGWF